MRTTGINENPEQQVQGVLNLNDFAGSERLSRSGATGDHLKETQGNTQQLAAYHKNLQDCIKWYLKVEKEHLLAVERVQNLLNAC
ncbi:hypothetical protein ABKV19_006873 [Rosa sericea]